MGRGEKTARESDTSLILRSHWAQAGDRDGWVGELWMEAPLRFWEPGTPWKEYGVFGTRSVQCWGSQPGEWTTPHLNWSGGAELPPAGGRTPCGGECMCHRAHWNFSARVYTDCASHPVSLLPIPLVLSVCVGAQGSKARPIKRGGAGERYIKNTLFSLSVSYPDLIGDLFVLN